jgi:hypothetical protein
VVGGVEEGQERGGGGVEGDVPPAHGHGQEERQGRGGGRYGKGQGALGQEGRVLATVIRVVCGSASHGMAVFVGAAW